MWMWTLTSTFGHEYKNLLVVFIYRLLWYYLFNSIDTANIIKVNKYGQPRPILHARNWGGGWMPGVVSKPGGERPWGWMSYLLAACNKGQDPLHQFPRNKFKWWLICSKSTKSPQHKRHVRNKLAQWRGQAKRPLCVLCRFPNSITTTCCQLVGRIANKSVTSWQLPLLWGVMGKRVMDFEHKLAYNNWHNRLITGLFVNCTTITNT